MATEILAIGSTSMSSSDIVLASGESVALFVKGAGVALAQAGSVVVELKDAANGWVFVADLIGPPQSLTGAGTYRVRRVSNRGQIGVDRG